ncbi:MAG: GspE/PulE family protein [Acidobacteriaceae bacterium]
MFISTKDRDIRLKNVYSELDRKFEEEETERNAKKFKIPYINLFRFPVDLMALGTIPKDMAESSGAVVFFRESRNVKIGLTEPENKLVAEIIKGLSDQSYFVEKFMISKSSYHDLIANYSRAVHFDSKASEISIHPHSTNIKTVEELSDHLSNASATDVIERILGPALDLDSSDIHLEPIKDGMKLRYRIDGVLQDVAQLPAISIHLIVSRLKLLSKLKLNLTTVPQDGSFHLLYADQPVDIRVSIIPSSFGESVVMRLLRQDRENLKFEDLGISGLALQRLNRQLEKPNGMILTTGPTGSGKTTTLYSLLSKLNGPGVKIITLEDPVEYRIEGITQTPIDAGAGMTFASGLRAILRQDPDIVMVGEMRDLETAEIAAQAALTGHIVLSSLHTNDAPSAIPRLLDLGVKPFILAPAINAVVAQRLVRKICPFCKKEEKLDSSLSARVQSVLDAIPKSAKVALPKPLKFYQSSGCEKCKGLGYKGRIGVYEVFEMNDQIERLIHKQASTSEVRQQAVEDGMITMSQDGLIKALNGITDVAEVFRVTEG